jgi:3-keto-disaccharide hydrolase
MNGSQPSQCNPADEPLKRRVKPMQLHRLMKRTSILFGPAVLLATLAFAADYNLGELAKAKKIELFNRTLDPAKAGSPEAVFLTAASNDGLAWITGVEFSEGTIELEIKGKDQQGRSFVGIAFHGQDNKAFDAVYLRPFNFHAAAPERRSHSIQYVAMPDHDWSDLRNNHPGKYEAQITPAPDPDSWVKLKLVIEGNKVTAFVNDSNLPALTVELLNDRLKGKVALWVGNGSDGWFKNLKVTAAKK